MLQVTKSTSETALRALINSMGRFVVSGVFAVTCGVCIFDRFILMIAGRVIA